MSNRKKNANKIRGVFKQDKYIKYALGLFLCFSFFTHCKTKHEGPTYKIHKGNFRSVLTETGELQSVNARIISMPYIGWRYGWRFKITGLVEHGKMVKKGDSIARFDGSSVKKALIEKNNTLEVEKATLNKLITQQDIKLKNLESQIQIAQSAFDLKKIQFEKFKFESKKKKSIQKKQLQKAQIELTKAKDKYKLTEIIIQNELKIQQIKVKQLMNDIEDARLVLSKLTVRSPINGMMQILENRRTNNIMQIGDEVSQGRRFASVPDLSRMRIKSTVNEDDYFKIFVGQKVVSRLDAFPKKKFAGTISSIGKISYKKDKNSPIKVFDIEIILDNTDPILKPGMTTSCDIFVSDMQNAFFVPNDCIIKDSAVSYIIIKEDGGDIKKQEVSLGPVNSKFTVIYGEVKEGAELVPRKQETEGINI